jgi:hypothetical protein
MQKLLFAVFFTLLSTPSFAAQNDYGAVGGFQLAVGSASSSGSEPTLTTSTAYGGGVEIGYMVNKSFSLEMAYTTVSGPSWDVVSVTNSSTTINGLIFINTSNVHKNAIYLMAGMGALTTSANLTDSRSRSNQGGIFGVGYEFNHGQMNAFRIGLSVYDTGYNQVRTIHAGPVWKF